MKSCLYIEIYTFNCVNFEKLRADKLSRSRELRERELFKVSLDLSRVQYPHGTVKEQIK